MTTTYEFTAFAEADLLSGGDTNLHCGDTFTMPAEATTCFAVKDDDAFLSGDSVHDEQANDHSYQTASISDAASGNELGTGGQIYAESYYWLADDSGNWYVMIEIEQEGVDDADFFTFYTGGGYSAPAPGTSLTVHSQCNVDSNWIDFKCLDAGEKKSFVECDYQGAVKLDFEGLASGEVVSDQFDGVTIRGSENGEGNDDNDAMIFDSNTLSGGDSDLLTTTQNNILIVSEDDDSSDPDDAVGGKLFFDFDNPARVFDIKIIDAEEGGFIDMFDADGNLLKCVEIPNGVNGGIQQVLLEQDDVSTLKVRLNGSGAVDDLCYVPGEDPTGSISGTVWCDEDCDGLQDAGSETCVLGPNLVVNGDFEDNSLGNSGAIWDLQNGDLPGWFFVGTNKADLLEENLEGHGNATGQAIIDLDQGSILCQEVTVPTAGTYVLSLDLLQNPHIDTNDNRIKVFINGVEREIVRAEGQNTVEIELDLPAGVVRLDFKSLSSVNDGPGIDAIKLQEKTFVLENGEDVKEGVLVALLDEDGNAVLDGDGNPVTTFTDAEGNYTFDDVPVGDYQVQFTAPDGIEFTLQDAGSDDTIDSDVDANGNSGVITVSSDETTDIDAGLKEVEEPGEVCTFQLTNHTSNGDNHGLRLDDLLGTGSFVFDFEAPGACMFATIDPNNDTVHIFGTAVGSDGSVFRIDFVYNNAEPKAGDDDIQVDDQFDKTNIGSIERLNDQGVAIEKFELADKSGSHPFTFRIGDEDDDNGHRGATGDSGWGWLYVDGARNAVQDWIFELEDKIELTATDDFITVTESEEDGDIETLDDGNTSILANDDGAATVVTVNGVVGNVGEFIDLPQGRLKINADGTVDFDADGDFEDLVDGESQVLSVTYSIGEEAVGNLIVNGGFENHPTLTRGSGTSLWDTFEEIEGWTTPVGVLEIQEGTHGGTPENLATNAVLELDSDDSADTNATVVQTVDVTRTGTYILAFDYSPREKHGVIAPTSILNIWLNGALVDSITSDELGYVRHTYELKLTEGTNEIGFSAGGTDDTFGALIDDVTLVGKIREEATVQITVLGENDLADDDEAVTVDEDAGPVTLPNVLDNTTDPEGGDPTVVNVGAPSNGGVFVINPDGTATFDTNGDFEALAGGETATTTVTYTVEDAAGDQVTSTVTVTVEGVNDLADDDETATVGEDDGLVTLTNVLDNTDDPEAGDPTVVSVGAASNGGVFSIGPDGEATFDTNGDFEALAAGETAITTVEYTVEDAAGDQVTSTVTITVEGLNDLADEGESVTVDEDAGPVTLPNVLDNTTDPEGGDPTVVNVGAPSNGGVFVINPDGTATFDTNGDFEALAGGETATTTVTYTVEDAAGDQVTSTVTVTVEGVNDLADDDETATVGEDDGLVTLTNVLDNTDDPEAGDPTVVSVGAASNGGVFSIGPDGEATFDTNGDFEALAAGETAITTVEYTVEDAAGDQVTSTVTITVEGLNDLADEGESVTVDEDAGPVTLPNVLDNTTDPEGGDPTVVNVGAPSNGGVFVINPDGTATFDTNGDFEALVGGETATTTVTYTVEDAAGDQVTSTVTVTVEGVNDLADDDETATVGEDDGLVTLTNVLDNTDDPEAGDPTVVSVGAASNGGVFSIGPDGEATFDTNGDFEALGDGETAVTTVEYTVEDAAGDQVTSTVTVTVEGVNDLEDEDECVEVSEDTGLTVLTNALDNTFDPEAGDPFIFAVVDGGVVSESSVGQPIAGSNGGLFIINADGTTSFDPNGEFEFLGDGESTTTEVIYCVTDADGKVVESFYKVVVQGVNDLADEGEAVTVGEDSGLTVLPNVLDNTVDPEAGDPVVINFGAPSNGGVFSIGPNGEATFDTNGDFEDLAVGETAITTVEYTVEDAAGDQVTSTVTITVEGVNDLADEGEAVTVGEDSGLITLPNVLDNTTDPEAGDPVVVNVGAPSSGGVFSIGPNGEATFDTNGDFEDLAVGETAITTVEYTVEDAAGDQVTSTVTITVEGVNDLADDDETTTVTEDAGLITLENVLDNTTDPEAGDPVVVAVGAPSNGGVFTINPDGSATFDTNGDFEALASGESTTTSVTYTVEDAAGDQVTSTYTIIVKGFNDLADDDETATVGEDAGLVTLDNVLDNTTDPEAGDPVVVNVGSASNGGVFTIAPDGTATFDTNGDFEDLGAGETATTSVTYTVEDVAGDQVSSTVTVTVLGAEEPFGSIAGRAFCDANENAVDDAGDSAIVQQTAVLLNPDGTAVLDTFGDPILAFTGNDGSYSFDPVPVGDYRVGFEVLGAKDFVVQGADLDGDGRSDDPNASDVDDAAAPISVSLGLVSIIVSTTDVFTVNAGEDVTDVDAGLFNPEVGPDAVDDAFTTTEDAPVFEDVLGNDSDANGDTLSILSANGTGVNTSFGVTSADGRTGTAIVSATGVLNFAFDPNGGFEDLAQGETDTVTVSYTITDGTGLTDTAEVVVTVNGLNDGPDAIDDAFTVPEDGLVVEDLLANDSDPENDTLEIIEADGNAVGTQFSVTSSDGREGTAIVSAGGALNFAFDTNGGFDTLNDGETDTVTVSYTITDGNGLTDTANVTVTIEGAGQPTALVSGSLDNTGPGDRQIAIILDASQDAVSTANAFAVEDFDNDGNVGTTMDQMLSKVSDLALTLESTDLITLLPSGFNGIADTATVVNISVGVLQNAIAIDQANGDIATQQFIFNGLVSSYTQFDFSIDFAQAFEAAASAFAASSGFEQNKIIAMVASEASFIDQGGEVGFFGVDVAQAFDEVINPPSNADVDILIVDPLASISAANLGLLDSDGVADVDVGTDAALADFVDAAPIVSSAANIVSFTVTVDGVADPDIDISDLTPTADGFDFLPTDVLEGVIDVIVGLDLNADGFKDQARLLSSELTEAERTLAQGDVFDFTIDTFVSDQISLGG